MSLASIQKKNALRFIFLLGIVSLFADMTYEGGRSITGPYLSLLGAGAATVGFVGGAGELAGYALRLVSGYIADRTRKYWLITILGYAINLLAVPLLALAGRWEVAAILIVAERFGKALRTPSRDAMLSYATRQVGTGFGFGLHELMDQIGAVTGPLIAASALYFKGNHYQLAFAFLFLPASLGLLMLFFARLLFPNPEELEEETAKLLPSASKKLPPVFWLYISFTALSVAGYAHFQLISYHFKAQNVIPDAQIPLLFALAMGVDALVALPIGKLFDQKGLPSLVVLPLFTLPVPFLVFSFNYWLAALGVLLWGAAMGVQETIMRAAIAEIIPREKRGLAYGIFNTAYGVAWFLGSVLLGSLYAINIFYPILVAAILEALSLPLLFKIFKT
ncbi:Major Facilitator Superfamily protein [Thermanaeromonas toyohensis ToBE]|uniref:Major Facilitator Superfamily protein n=1 Tax=Thermanaeromonas toyohensis ToBE TaxID=698762 RepID=A0A1W1W1G6_9FIRM|nr:MFS transporter [Thermanaeromonas toyohensis]SMB99330.1 Major Facilitator Superfamily protein [Thermanaeromonas toyohensis ToBE]